MNIQKDVGSIDLYEFSATTAKVDGYDEFKGMKLWNVKVVK